MLRDLKDKTAVVFGASSGIGLALAMELAREGMNLVVTSRSKDRIESAATLLRGSGAEIETAVCDVADFQQVLAVATKARAVFGAVDLLCNNAGVTTLGPLADHTIDDWKWLVDVNIMGVVHGINAFLPLMIEQGSGHICNTGSPTAFMPDAFVGHGPYPATKAAVAALTTSLRHEVSSKGVEVTLLLPSGVQSDIMRGAALHGPGKPGEFHMELNPGLPVPDSRGRQFTTAEFLARMTVAGIKQNVPVIAAASALRPIAAQYFDRILTGFDVWADFEPKLPTSPGSELPHNSTAEHLV